MERSLITVLKTNSCTDLANQSGKSVVAAGWIAKRRDHGGVAFFDLRDATGVVQVVVHDADLAHSLKTESCVAITGKVQARPEGNENSEIPTGKVELVAESIQIFSSAGPLPFQIDESDSVGDELRLKYRYLDLRRPEMASKLKLRSRANAIARNVLLKENFVEVETPTFTRSTPEGARDFLVPVRLQPGKWYALPQSPQLYKQLLMVAGLERYFQIARCYRDEDFRADRQPEFTQLDIEMSFVEQDDVIAIGEAIIRSLWQELGNFQIPKIEKLTYWEAMRRYGSDKPDLRYGLELVELKEYFKDTPFRVFQSDYVGAIVMPGGASQSRKQMDAWQEWAKQRGAAGLAWVTFSEDAEVIGPVAKNISDSERAGLMAALGAKPGDAVFFAAGEVSASRNLLAAARAEIAERLGLAKDGEWSFVWIVDAPMFELTDEGNWTSVHHPFTSPHTSYVESFDQDPGTALAWAYDIVCNGYEIGGGSIRIHDSKVQSRVFSLLGISDEQAKDKFGFLLEAFEFGPPPHGGIAFGWDRICMLLAGADNLREVIAFPKTGGGSDPLTGAPTFITQVQRREANIDAKPETKTT
ncbi:MAG: aspartyl-tRNA synthase [actinobacterium acAMD-5]|nr:MAG: aspartyl-tRNA synthase [actinobacterium acAMD-5]